MSLIEKLKRLFEIDGQVRGLRRRLDAAERYLATQTRLAEALETRRKELDSRHLEIQARIGILESDTAALDERLEKLRNELNAATTNKQYSAVLTELNAAKAQRSDLEDRILQEMEQVEENQQLRDQLAGEIEERETLRAKAERDLAQRHEEVGQRLAELEAERETAAAEVPGPDRRVFEKLADDYDGEAMAPIEEVDRRHREYACGECRMRIPFEMVSSLLSSGDVLVQCTACDRILYMQEEMRGALLKK
jgi:predicted  nucleic acid-binding Zn-ribbon protein